MARVFPKETVGTLTGSVDINTMPDVKLDASQNTVKVGGEPVYESDYYEDQDGTALDGTWQTHTFGFRAMNISIFNDSETDVLLVRFETGMEHKLYAGESYTWTKKGYESVDIKGTTDEPYRVKAT